MTLPVADQIERLDAGGSVVLPQRPLRLAGGILGALAFTGFGALMIILGVRDAQTTGVHAGTFGAFALGLVCVGFFGVFCLLGLILAAVRPHRLVVTADGFREEVRRASSWGVTGRVSWGEVAEVSIMYVPIPRWPGRGRPFLAYVLTDEGVDRRRREAVARRPGARRTRRPPQRVMMRTVFGSARDLLPLFEAAHRRFGGDTDRSGAWR